MILIDFALNNAKFNKSLFLYVGAWFVRYQQN